MSEKEQKKPAADAAGGDKEVGYIKPREIVAEMQESYLDYAMSVIVSRALPDVRDGLKPVHRRILYTMYEDGLRHNVKFRKSATVVGSCLGRYHPHGDMAVYDAMVRMAQDFSLRYPLVKGQGNFGCFTKDTKIKLTDGRDLSFEELVEEYKAGKKNYTYTVNKLGLISIADIKNPRITKVNAELIRVSLDNGSEIRCTANHLFMLRDGSYKEAQFLSEGESLMPLYQKVSEKTDRINRSGYILILQNKIKEWVPVHHLADNYNLTTGKYSKSKGRVRHHLDFNRFNNSPENIIRMDWGEHWKVHYEHVSLQHKDAGYRQKIAEGRNRYWSNPLNKEKQRRAISIRNTNNWQDPNYREKMRIAVSEANKKYIAEHPEKIQELSERATKTLKRLWKDPVYRALFHEKIIEGNKHHKHNATGKNKFLKICKEILAQGATLNEKNYGELRNKIYSYGCAPLWSTGLTGYFQSNVELVYQELNNNHKVLKVENIGIKEDVYDLTVDGTHNFCLAAGVFVHNSIDGDASASMRYTEAKLSAIGEEILTDIEKDTVDFMDNYDGTRQEPKVLPSPMPQLLFNGSLGIAVGMATNIPTHNAAEVLDSTIHLLENPEATTEDLFQFFQGPDFPTGGIIYGKKDIIAAYSQGKGPILTRGRAEIQETKKGNPMILISEIPFQVQKSSLVQQIAKLVEDKRLDGIRDVRDESDREGMRVVIELKKESFPKKVLNALYKFTDLQKVFHLNMLALVDGIQPRVLSLTDVLTFYLNHKKEVVLRRTRFELQKAKDRAHILEGLMLALKNIDEIIRLIKKSESREDAHKNLQQKYKLSAAQATAILEMKLQQLAKLEQAKIEKELEELEALMKELTLILNSPQRVKQVMKKELLAIRDKYKDNRRTKMMIGKPGEIGDEDLIPQEEALLIMTQGGLIKRLKPSVYRIQKRGGKGVAGVDVSEEDIVEHFLVANTLNKLMFFTDSGKLFQCFVWEIPEMGRLAKGRGLLNFIDVSPQDKVLSMLSYGKKDEESAEKYLVMVTKDGIIKKTVLSAFKNVRRNGLLAVKLQSGDLMRSARMADKEDEISLVTKKGMSIRFKESDIRSMGRGAAGVRGIKLASGDEVIGMDIIKKSEIINPKSENAADKYLLIITENGYGKRTKVSEYRLQYRGGTGIKAAKINEKTGKIVLAKILDFHEEDLVVISKKGQVIRSSLKSISVHGRATSGVRVMRLSAGDRVASGICLLREKEEAAANVDENADQATQKNGKPKS